MYKQKFQSSTETRGDVGYVTISGTSTFYDYMVYAKSG